MLHGSGTTETRRDTRNSTAGRPAAARYMLTKYRLSDTLPWHTLGWYNIHWHLRLTRPAADTVTLAHTQALGRGAHNTHTQTGTLVLNNTHPQHSQVHTS